MIRWLKMKWINKLRKELRELRQQYSTLQYRYIRDQKELEALKKSDARMADYFDQYRKLRWHYSYHESEAETVSEKMGVFVEAVKDYYKSDAQSWKDEAIAYRQQESEKVLERDAIIEELKKELEDALFRKALVQSIYDRSKHDNDTS